MEINKNLLNSELNLLKSNQVLKSLVRMELDSLPDKFWWAPASSTGKYHPLIDRGMHGLIYHTRLAVHFGIELVKMNGTFHDNKEACNIVIGALLLHDGLKYGENGEFEYTVNNHHELMYNKLIKDAKNMDRTPQESEYLVHMADLILTHHGIYSDPQPDTELKWLVHYADNLASKLDDITACTKYL